MVLQRPSDHEPNVFLNDDIPHFPGIDTQRHSEESGSELTGSEEDASGDLSEDGEPEASEPSEEWVPSEEESSECSTASAIRTKPGLASSAKTREKNEASVVPGRVSLAKVVHGKENDRPKPIASRRSDCRKPIAVKLEPEDENPLMNAVEMESADISVSAAKAKNIRGTNKTVGKQRCVKMEMIEDTMVIPNKAARDAAVAAAGDGAVYVPEGGEVDVLKKKKRKMLGRAAVVTEEQMLELAREKDVGSHGSPSKLKRAGRT